MPGGERRTRARRRVGIQWAAFLAGPALAALCVLSLPETYQTAAGETAAFSAAGRATLGLMAWMAVWWLFEAIPLPATALLPVVYLPLAQAAGVRAAAEPYADPLIFLFLGGFLIAMAMQRWSVDRRIALAVLGLVGTRPRRMVAGVMLVTAGLSMFVSNTATSAMMLPIALSVVELVRRETGAGEEGRGDRERFVRNFTLCMMLGIAYAATIGGIGTKIGTPPNGLLLAFIERNYGRQIDFFTWLGVGLPLVAVFLPLAWLVLTRAIYPVGATRIEGADVLLRRERAEMGPMGRPQRVTLAVFGLTALGWISRPLLAEGYAGGPGPAIPALFPGLTDAGVAMLGALLLFGLPVDRRGEIFALDWDTAKGIPWGILVLFGGGLSLASAVQANGVDRFIGNLAAGFAWLPEVGLVVAVTVLVILLTELTSNTATTATLLPVLAPIAASLGYHPYLFLIPAAIAASCAFMLPVATPPNAIVFGSGYVRISDMSRAGIWLNLIGVVLVTALVYTVAMPLLGFGSVS